MIHHSSLMGVSWKPCYFSLQRAYLHVYETKEVRYSTLHEIIQWPCKMVLTYLNRVPSLLRLLSAPPLKEPVRLEHLVCIDLRLSLVRGIK